MASAQDLYKLSPSEIDEPINSFLSLPANYKDSVYKMRILYPDYKPLKRAAARKYRRKMAAENLSLPETPAITYDVFVDRKKATMRASFNPIVERNRKLYKLTDFDPSWISAPKEAEVDNAQNARGMTRASSLTASSSVYASSSRLASGSWAKIRVSETGICRLSSDVISEAGFSDITKVKIYGFGGALVPEQLTQDWIESHDDLPEVAVCPKDGQLYFYAYGPVSYESKTTTSRTRNPYSDYGYYLITQNDDVRNECSEEDLLNTAAANAAAYHDLYEKDEYAWHEMGRELVESEEIQSSKTVTLSVPDDPGKITVTAVLTAGERTNYSVTANDGSKSGVIRISTSEQLAMFETATFKCSGSGSLPVTITCSSGGPIKIDYILATFSNPKGYPALSTAYPAAEFVSAVPNQNHHADDVVDFVIIIPTSKKLYTQAKRLGDLHASHDGMTYRIVPADELYNEFSSGTPDVSAYRRYLKMFYDRNSDGGVKNVLLLGDCIWDNRMKTLSDQYSPDDYLLVYETYNSYDKTRAIPIDDFIAILQDGMTVHADGKSQSNMQMDCGVGRIPVTSDVEAKYVVDKIVDYVEKSPSGKWQNGVTFIGDDGDENSHMKFINDLADDLIAKGGYNVKKIMADAYVLKKTATGNRYPDVEKLVKQLQNEGQLIMNYGGHGSWTQLSHEKILTLDDVKNFKGENYSMWIMAACETMPYDYTRSTFGEQLLLNKDGGSIITYGAARAVYETYNSRIDKYMMEYILGYDADGKPYTVGEAQRLAKNQMIKDKVDMTINKHHYAILGDPALALAIPTHRVKVDRINGVSADQSIQIKALSTVTVEGHIETRDGQPVSSFNGTLSSTVKDAQQKIICRGQADSKERFQYSDYDSNIFAGTTNVQGGQFNFTFRVPKDIYDENTNGLIVLYACDENNKFSANGTDSSVYPYGTAEAVNDSIGPSIHSYLNNPSFINGGNVGRTPFFVAEINDADGINVAESSLGHYMELIVDGDANMTFDLNDNFTFNADSYTSGTTWYVLPNLSLGKHSLTFRAWDVLNNSSQVSLDFNVVKGFEPTIDDVFVSPNPSKVGESVTFYVTHDLQGSEAEVNIDIIDMTGRIVGQLQWSDTFSATKPTTTYKWPVSGLSQGMYLYRVRLSSDNSKSVSKTKKLLIGY